MQVETVEIATLVEDRANARKHAVKNLESIKGSLARFGQQKPIVVGRSNVVIAGNGTLRAARELGWTEIWVRRTDLEGTEAVAFALADNRSGELAEWDAEILSETLKGLVDVDFDLKSIGFDADDLARMIASEEEPGEGQSDEDEIPSDVEPRTKIGDLWALGKHRLLCGDSTNPLDVDRVRGGLKVDAIFTDPPYGIAFKAMRKDFDAIKNDGNASEAVSVVRDALALLQGTETAFVCCDWRSLPAIVEGMSQAGLEPKACIVWDKMRGVQNLDRYFKQHEFIIYAGPYGGQKTQAGDVWQCARDFEPDHPTPKPVQLIERALTTATRAGQVVADLFAGSGSTLIACEKTRRRCLGIEIDPRYCDVIVERWERFTGQKATLEEPCPTDSTTSPMTPPPPRSKGASKPARSESKQLS